MDDITDVRIKPLEQSEYKPFTMHYVQNGVKKSWDLLIADERIIVLVYNTSRNTLLFLKQFRPAVYYGSVPQEDRIGTIDTKKYPPKLGITIELGCRPISNKLSHLEDAKTEVLDSFGYDVPLASIKKIAGYRAGVGTTGNKQTAFYCEVSDNMKVANVNNAKDDIVQIVEMSVDEAKKYVQQKLIPSPANFLFGVYWFLYKQKLAKH